MYLPEMIKKKYVDGIYWQSVAVNWRTDNAMARRKRKKNYQAMINKTLHSKLKIEQHEPH